MKLDYRPEIDGLRAVAVLAVVLDYAELFIRGADPFKGGFIGVVVQQAACAWWLPATQVLRTSNSSVKWTRSALAPVLI